MCICSNIIIAIEICVIPSVYSEAAGCTSVGWVLDAWRRDCVSLHI